MIMAINALVFCQFFFVGTVVEDKPGVAKDNRHRIAVAKHGDESWNFEVCYFQAQAMT